VGDNELRGKREENREEGKEKREEGLLGLLLDLLAKLG
jgi:hypothetical protein